MIDIAAQLLDEVALDEMKEFRFQEAMITTFANGIVVGLLVADNKQDRPKPLIEH